MSFFDNYFGALNRIIAGMCFFEPGRLFKGLRNINNEYVKRCSHQLNGANSQTYIYFHLTIIADLTMRNNQHNSVNDEIKEIHKTTNQKPYSL